MKNRPERIKNALFTIIRRLCADPELVERPFRAFQFKPGRLYQGHRLPAIDGSDVQIPTDLTDPDSYFEGTRGHIGRFAVVRLAVIAAAITVGL